MQLNDKELEKVVGGGSGHCDEGLIISAYNTIEGGYYYTSDLGVNRDGMIHVFYCASADNDYQSYQGSFEYLYFDSDNNWYTKSNYHDHFTSTADFKNNLPYRLNVRP